MSDPSFSGLDLQAFEQLFRDYYEALYYHAYRYVGRQEEAEELVQDVFVTLWEKRRHIKIKDSVKAYLYASVRNRALNYLKSRMAQERKALPLEEAPPQFTATHNEQQEAEKELAELLKKGIANLPEKCRHIFQLSRQSGLTYEEIAEELGVSRETVKTQIRIAILKLRTFVGEHWEAMVWLVVSSGF